MRFESKPKQKMPPLVPALNPHDDFKLEDYLSIIVTTSPVASNPSIQMILAVLASIHTLIFQNLKNPENYSVLQKEGKSIMERTKNLENKCTEEAAKKRNQTMKSLQNDMNDISEPIIKTKKVKMIIFFDGIVVRNQEEEKKEKEEVEGQPIHETETKRGKSHIVRVGNGSYLNKSNHRKGIVTPIEGERYKEYISNLKEYLLTNSVFQHHYNFVFKECTKRNGFASNVRYGLSMINTPVVMVAQHDHLVDVDVIQNIRIQELCYLIAHGRKQYKNRFQKRKTGLNYTSTNKGFAEVNEDGYINGEVGHRDMKQGQNENLFSPSHSNHDAILPLSDAVNYIGFNFQSTSDLIHFYRCSATPCRSQVDMLLSNFASSSSLSSPPFHQRKSFDHISNSSLQQVNRLNAEQKQRESDINLKEEEFREEVQSKRHFHEKLKNEVEDEKLFPQRFREYFQEEIFGGGLSLIPLNHWYDRLHFANVNFYKGIFTLKKETWTQSFSESNPLENWQNLMSHSKEDFSTNIRTEITRDNQLQKIDGISYNITNNNDNNNEEFSTKIESKKTTIIERHFDRKITHEKEQKNNGKKVFNATSNISATSSTMNGERKKCEQKPLRLIRNFIEDSFGIYVNRHFKQEGLKALNRYGTYLYQEEDPTIRFTRHANGRNFGRPIFIKDNRFVRGMDTKYLGVIQKSLFNANASSFSFNSFTVVSKSPSAVAFSSAACSFPAFCSFMFFVSAAIWSSRDCFIIS